MNPMMLFALIFVVFACCAEAASDFTLQIDASSRSFSFNISSKTDPSIYWLRSGPTTSFVNKFETLNAADQTLLFVNISESKGRDIIGTYQRTQILWTGNTKLNPPHERYFETNFRLYDSLGENYDSLAIVFEQRWPSGAVNTSNGDVHTVLSSFPSFEIPKQLSDDALQLGMLQWTGSFAADYVLSPWSLSTPYWPRLQIENGTDAGPIAHFSNDKQRYASMLAPFNSFMDVSTQQVDNEVRFGVLGTMKYIPADYSADTIVFLAPSSLTETVTAWGELMLKYYSKSKADTYAEDQITTNYIGYATDNGAYYYYNQEPNKTYEQTMHDVKDEFTAVRFPYHFMELDSWWYFKGVNNGVKNWTAMPDVFPHGLVELHKSLGNMRFVAHNKYFSADNDYAKQNGGDYEWLIEKEFSLPLEQRFWDNLFVNASRWGLFTYEQDWLYNEYDGMKALTETPGLGRQWLTQMGNGAKRSGINIQYCLSYSRILLQSLEIPAVRQARASRDYEPSNEKWNNWEIGLSSILIGAIGLAPHKDTFLTTVDEPGNPYNVRGEPLPDFQAALATISGGPVMPGSGLTFTNWTLLNYSIRADGLIMRGDRVSTMPDDLIYKYVFERKSDSGPVLEDDYVMATSVSFEEGPEYTIGVRAKTTGCDQMYTQSTHTQTCLDVAKVDQKSARYTTRTFYAPQSVTESKICGWEWFSSALIIPPLLIQGERFKWVPVSKQRMTQWQGTNITLAGAPNEQVVFEHLDVSTTPAVRYADECALDARGRGEIAYDTDDLQRYRCNGQLHESKIISESIETCGGDYPMPSVDSIFPHTGSQHKSSIVTANE